MTHNNRKIVIINQAVNYLTVGICNEFSKKFSVDLITGSIHEQGEVLNPNIKVSLIQKWQEKHGIKKLLIYILATIQIYWMLITKYRKYEVLFISLPPMGYLLNIILPNRFSMLIWDVYPDIFKITGMKSNHLVYKVWSWMNKKSFKKAYKLFTIGSKTAELLGQYVSREKIIVSPIWSVFQEEKIIKKGNNPFIKQHGLKDKFVIQYSGNIGLTHNVEILIEIAKKMVNYPKFLFMIIGRGPRKSELEEKVKTENITNCVFLPFQPDNVFPYSLSAADLGVVILDKAASKGSVPSKSYNLMSFGIPSLYIASSDSELYNYAKNYRHGECFDNSDISEVVEFIREISENDSKYEIYSKNSIKASKDFKRTNAEKIVNKYINI